MSRVRRSARRLWRWAEGRATPLGSAEAAACGPEHGAYVASGQLFTFGSSRNGRLGREGGPEPEPVVLEASDGHRPLVEQVALGGHHSAAITEGGALWTWGYGGSFFYGAGGLGLGRRGDIARPELVMHFVEQGAEVVQVACGDLHSVVLDREGRVFSCGQSVFGALGRGGLVVTGEELSFAELIYFRRTTDSVLNPGVEPQVVKIGAGADFSAAMSAHGEIWVWGRNDYGQLGMGFEVMRDRDFCMKYPFLLRQLPMEGHVFRDFACGANHMVAVTTAGAIWEWGNRRHFEPTALTLPSRYEEGIQGIWKVSAGDGTSFALTLDGELYAWGRAGSLLPSDLARPSKVNAEVFGNQKVVDIAAAKSDCLVITEE